jgi:hypothetical protein
MPLGCGYGYGYGYGDGYGYGYGRGGFDATVESMYSARSLKQVGARSVPPLARSPSSTTSFFYPPRC